ncbi:MAG: hypothetical protein GY950_21605 [bacterium]|nr:hypothetical protein [bacterium]
MTEARTYVIAAWSCMTEAWSYTVAAREVLFACPENRENKTASGRNRDLADVDNLLGEDNE